ncbi:MULTISPECIES: hypothetical protein [Glaesserella]|uniref:Uncharacterized protein n=1 Tax=Glaesserella australis TaxID=2094024 RepID=A0A328BXQ8_9PAST|nr:MULTISPECIES: hypothetical protein [Glaesserella]AUI67058.1 hypothetical protein CJD39_11000 [Glaesserella sp. 15-184]RAL18849.1 hypothetical protein C5N92_05650 [Glaesserella australis]
MSKSVSEFNELRIQYNNKWLSNERFLFESEKELIEKLHSLEKRQIIDPVIINNEIDKDIESTSISYILEMLDCLPLRPDNGFDFIWKILDSISDAMKEDYQKRNGLEYKEARIKLIYHDINSDSESEKIFKNLISEMSKAITLTSCKFISKRIFEHHKSFRKNNDRQAKTFEGRLVNCISDKRFIELFYSKFFSSIDSNHETNPTSESLRDSARLLQKLIHGEKIKLGGHEFYIKKREEFFSLIICTQYRNERAHGDVSPPFRRSSAKLETFSLPYFLMIYSYYSLILVLWNMNKKLFDLESIESSIKNTIQNFKNIFNSNK